MLRRFLRIGIARTIALCFVLSCLCVTEAQSSESMTFWRRIDSNGKIVTEVRYTKELPGGVGNDSFRNTSLAPGSYGGGFIVSEAEGKQGPPKIAYNSSNNEYLVVWWDERDEGAMGRDIYGRLLSWTSDTETDEIPIAASFGDQEYPDVAYNSVSNEYMVVWIDSDTDTDIVYAQRLAATGESLGAAIVIAVAPHGSVVCIAHNSSDNSYLAVWHTGDVFQQEADIYGQILSSEGGLSGNSFAISEAENNQLNPALVYDSVKNEYVVVWQDYRKSRKTPDDEVRISIYGQRVSDSKLLEGGDYAISPIESMNWEQLPDVAYNKSQREFLVVWQDDRGYPEEADIYGRIMNNTGLGLASFAISIEPGWQDNPAVACNDIDTEYVVVWDDEESSDTNNKNIYGQHIPFTGLLDKGSFVVSDAGGEQAFPDIAYNSNENRYFMVWRDGRNEDATGFDIYARWIPDQGGQDDVVVTVEVLSPVGGEVWKGAQEIRWEAKVVEGQGDMAVALQHSADGAHWTDISFDGVNDGSFTWDTTSVPDGQCKIKAVATVVGNGGQWEDDSDYFTIDNTPPTGVSNLESGDHTVREWSNKIRIKVQWTPSTDVTSGLEGYSAIWDETPDTIPDTSKNTDPVADVTSPFLSSGNSHYFHIRPVDKVGNWGETEHLGPFYIDAEPPGEVAELSSVSHAIKIFSSNDTVKIGWKPAIDQESGLDGYSISWDTGLDALPDTTKDIEGGITELSERIPEGMDNYFYIRSLDNVGNWCDTAKHIGPFYIDTTSPTLDLISSSHQINTWSSISNVEIQMDAEDELSGLKGFLIIWDQVADTEPTDTSVLITSWTTNSPGLVDGEWYFHAKAVDIAGNLSAKLNRGPFKIDTTPPGAVSGLSSPSHTPGVASSDDTVDVEWTPAVDLGIGLDGYSVEWDTRSETLPDQIKDVDGIVTRLSSSPLTKDIDHYFHVRSVDRLGNWSGKAAHVGPFRAKAVLGFIISAEETTITKRPGESATYQIELEAKEGFSGDIELYASDLPSTIQLTFEPKKVSLSAARPVGACELTLKIPAEMELGAYSFTVLAVASNLETKDLTLTLKVQTASVVKGDVNGDGMVRSNDAILALRIAAGLDVPDDRQKMAADMNDDGMVRSNDAIMILRKATGLAAPDRTIQANISGSVSIRMSETYGLAREHLVVPLELDRTDGLAGGDICIAYDSKVLRAIDVSSTSGVLLVKNIVQPGLIRIAFAGAGLNSGKLAEIEFDILADSTSPLTFESVDLYGHDSTPIGLRKIHGKFTSLAILPTQSALLQNFPNPFNPETWMPYQLREGGYVTIRIHSSAGDLVRELKLGYRIAGLYVAQDRAAYWDGRNERGEKAVSGVYFYVIQAGEFAAIKKMVIAE